MDVEVPQKPPSTFDPFVQPVTLLLPDGTPFNITLTDLDEFGSYNVRICINYSSQIGASFVLLMVLLALTRHEKRGSPIFVLNALSLALNTIRSILQCLYFTGPFNHPYAYFAGDFSKVPARQYQISIAGIVLTFLLLLCIEVSLVLQVRVVCVTLRKVERFWIMVVTATVAMVAVGFRFALLVTNARAIAATEDFGHWKWLPNASNITTTISICFFCAIFVTKLGRALLQRRKLGLKQFGPMQVIFIMGCQTLIVPALFAVLQYTAPVPELGSQVLTVVAIFLPLSSMWASSSIPNGSPASSTRGPHRKLFGSDSYGSGESTRKSSLPGEHPCALANNDLQRSGWRTLDRDIEKGLSDENAGGR